MLRLLYSLNIWGPPDTLLSIKTSMLGELVVGHGCKVDLFLNLRSVWVVLITFTCVSFSSCFSLPILPQCINSPVPLVVFPVLQSRFFKVLYIFTCTFLVGRICLHFSCTRKHCLSHWNSFYSDDFEYLLCRQGKLQFLSCNVKDLHPSPFLMSDCAQC